MVKVLPDHFPQITLAIICIAWSVGHKIYYRNFLPSQQTKLITGIQESIILWIMGDTDIIAAHFPSTDGCRDGAGLHLQVPDPDDG